MRISGSAGHVRILLWASLSVAYHHRFCTLFPICVSVANLCHLYFAIMMLS